MSSVVCIQIGQNSADPSAQVKWPRQDDHSLLNHSVLLHFFILVLPKGGSGITFYWSIFLSYSKGLVSVNEFHIRHSFMKHPWSQQGYSPQKCRSVNFSTAMFWVFLTEFTPWSTFIFTMWLQQLLLLNVSTVLLLISPWSLSTQAIFSNIGAGSLLNNSYMTMIFVQEIIFPNP